MTEKMIEQGQAALNFEFKGQGRVLAQYQDQGEKNRIGVSQSMDDETYCINFYKIPVKRKKKKKTMMHLHKRTTKITIPRTLKVRPRERQKNCIQTHDHPTCTCFIHIQYIYLFTFYVQAKTNGMTGGLQTITFLVMQVFLNDISRLHGVLTFLRVTGSFFSCLLFHAVHLALITYIQLYDIVFFFPKQSAYPSSLTSITCLRWGSCTICLSNRVKLS